MDDIKGIIFRGIVGVAAPSAGWSISLSSVEAWLKVTSLLIGCAVGVVTLISLVRNLRKGE